MHGGCSVYSAAHRAQPPRQISGEKFLRNLRRLCDAREQSSRKPSGLTWFRRRDEPDLSGAEVQSARCNVPRCDVHLVHRAPGAPCTWCTVHQMHLARCTLAPCTTAYRRSNVIFMPCFVRSVTTGCGTTGCPGTSANFHRCAIVATTSTSSIQANDSPMH